MTHFQCLNAKLVAELLTCLHNSPTFDTLQTYVYNQSYADLGELLSQFHPMIDGLQFYIGKVDGHNAFEEIVLDILNQVFEYYFCRPGDLYNAEKMFETFCARSSNS